MLKFKNKLGLAALVAGAMMSANITAETVTGNASVTVLNAFTITETQPLSFGTLVAFADDDAAGAGGVATAELSSADGAISITNAGNASLTEVSAGQVGIYTISGAAPNTAITLTLPTSATLTDPSGTETKNFTLGTFTRTVVTSGTPFTTDTDATGTLVFNLGATLTTDATGASGSSAAEAYLDATYTGTYTVTADY